LSPAGNCLTMCSFSLDSVTFLVQRKHFSIRFPMFFWWMRFSPICNSHCQHISLELSDCGKSFSSIRNVAIARILLNYESLQRISWSNKKCIKFI
jgi:hypothetical protein